MPEPLALVIIMECPIPGPHVDADPVRIPPLEPASTCPVNECGADSPACVVAADNEPRYVDRGIEQFLRRPENVGALLTAGNRACQATVVFHYPGQTMFDALGDTVISGVLVRPGPSPLISAFGLLQPLCGFFDEAEYGGHVSRCSRADLIGIGHGSTIQLSVPLGIYWHRITSTQAEVVGSVTFLTYRCRRRVLIGPSRCTASQARWSPVLTHRPERPVRSRPWAVRCPR